MSLGINYLPWQPVWRRHWTWECKKKKKGTVKINCPTRRKEEYSPLRAELVYSTIDKYNFNSSYMHDIVCAQKWTSVERAIDFPTATVEHLSFPASTACNRRPQVFLCPQQSILLRIEPVCLGISATQTCILPCFSKKKKRSFHYNNNSNKRRKKNLCLKTWPI